MLKRNVQRKIRNWLAGLLGARVLRLWILTMRVRLIGFRSNGRHAVAPENGIYVLWHQRFFTPGAYLRRSGLRVLISQHSDGEMVARIITALGMIPVRGSSTRGGSKALLEFLRQEGPDTAMQIIVTPDGPQGPKHRFQSGAIYLASRTGLPIYCATTSASRGWTLPSWDAFRVPKPFSRAVIYIKDRIEVPADLDRDGIEKYRSLLEKRLQKLTKETDSNFNTLYAEAKPARELPRLEPAEKCGIEGGEEP